MVHAFGPSTQETGRCISEFKESLVYRVRAARATQRKKGKRLVEDRIDRNRQLTVPQSTFFFLA